MVLTAAAPLGVSRASWDAALDTLLPERGNKVEAPPPPVPWSDWALPCRLLIDAKSGVPALLTRVYHD